ncbi:unnamed protein product, partial [Mycena citricolor]
RTYVIDLALNFVQSMTRPCHSQHQSKPLSIRGKINDKRSFDRPGLVRDIHFLMLE